MPKRTKQRPRSRTQAIIDALWQGMRARKTASGRAPTEADLADFVASSDCPLDARADASERLATVMAGETERHFDAVERVMTIPADSPDHRAEDVGLESTIPEFVALADPREALGEGMADGLTWRELLARARDSAPYWMGISDTGDGPRTIHAMTAIGVRPLATIHAAWDTMPRTNRPKHPLAPVLHAWHNRGGPQFTPIRRGSVMDWHRADPGDMRLLDPGDAPAISEQAQLVLPLFDQPVHDDGTISWLLALYALSGGALDGKKNLPGALVMAVGAMAHLGIHARDSEFHHLYFPALSRHKENWRGNRPPPWPLDDPPPSIEEWLYPNGGMSKPDRDWVRVRDGLRDMGQRLTYLPIPGLGDVAWLFPGVIPQTRDDQLVELVIRIPASAAHGSRFDWPLFLRYAAGHSRLAKAYLSAVAHMGRSAKEGGFLTRQLPARVRKPDGQPTLKRNGRYKRDAALGFEANPHAKFVRPLTDRALARMCGFENPDKRQILRARETFAKLQADGVLELVRDDHGTYSLFGPPAEAQR